MTILVREEEAKEYRRVEEITKLAFSYPGRVERGGIGCPYEHWMVNELRKRDGILPLSLVAVDTENTGNAEDVENAENTGGTIVGHIICSKAEVRTENGVVPVLNMGPISVLPEYQRKGVGKALIYAMIEKATKLGYGAILFFGRPEYYPQFGFKEASEFGVTDSEGYNYPSFMGMELIPGYLKVASGGRFFESDVYNDELNREQVKAFDEQFSREEK